QTNATSPCGSTGALDTSRESRVRSEILRRCARLLVNHQAIRDRHLKEVVMQVGDVLRKKASRVVTVRMNETVAIAAQLMRANNISALVVKDVVRTECDTAVGMFTERDVVRAVGRNEQPDRNHRAPR